VSKLVIVLVLALAIAGVLMYKSQEEPPAVILHEVTTPQPDAVTAPPKPLDETQEVHVVEAAPAPEEAAASVVESEPAPEETDASAVEVAKPKLLPKLLDLGADKCVPCKMMAPILEKLKKEYAGRVDVQFIDVWKKPQASRDYGIQMIPTQIFFDSTGKERFRHTGFMSREDILAKWKELGML